MRKKEKHNKILAKLGSIFLVIFLVSGTLLVYNCYTYKRNKNMYATMASQVHSEITRMNHKKEENKLLAYKTLKQRNGDFVGWIYIDKTSLDYPVMQVMKDQNFYLRRNFDKKYSYYGTPFMDARCSADGMCDNTIIYGHAMKNEEMFGLLNEYKQKDYWRAHPIIMFDTLNETSVYQIMSVFKTTITKEGFDYYHFITAKDEKDYEKYVNKVKELSLYDTGITAQYGEKLLTLSTCEYSEKTSRLVIVAKKMGSRLY